MSPTGLWRCVHFLVLLLSLHCVPVRSQSGPDQTAMEALLNSLTSKPHNWTNKPNYCNWTGVTCDISHKVTDIVIKQQGLTGTLPKEIQNLTSLTRLEVFENNLNGSFPNLKGMSSLTRMWAHTNQFTSFPADDDFFTGLTALSDFDISTNPLQPWEIPKTLTAASSLTRFAASNASVVGKIPDYFNSTYMPSLTGLELGYNKIQGELPRSFAGTNIQTLRLENCKNLNGTLDVLQNMTALTHVHLNGDSFTGPLPDFGNLYNLKSLYVRDNMLTGIIPASLVNLPSLQDVTLSNNLFQGPMPMFNKGIQVDMSTGDMFCNQKAGQDCDPRVTTLLSIAKDMAYAFDLVENWKWSDPCNATSTWVGVTCSSQGNITGFNYFNKGVAGTISANFSLLTSLTVLRLNDNILTGTIPVELTKLPNLKNVDLSNNRLYGKVPTFGAGVVVKLDGNPDIGKDLPSTPSAPNGGANTTSNTSSDTTSSSTGWIIGAVIGSIVGLVLLGILICCCMRRKKQRRYGTVQSPSTLVLHPLHSGDQNALKVSVANNGHSDIQVEAGSMIISIQVLRSVTNDFNEDKILGKGGFGTVYEGELHDGTKIAVKRMQPGVAAEKGLHEFKSEIAVLTKVRHRHLVGLLGYCLDGNEKLLVYEHMPQGTLSRHLFNWKEEGIEPLGWTRRVTIALDVGRGVQYLHGLANEIFIHRDLKPSNILLGDDMRAKVADFGLVRLAPTGKASIETRLAGTFGYLAPEYAATGRMTLKVDVYSFGVILMELITGRKAIDESQPEESCHLVTWFRRKLIKKQGLPEIFDPTISVDEETLSSIITVAELAGHCSAREPYQRPDIGHAVNVLSSLVEQWKPSKQEEFDEMDAINFNVSLNEAVKMWQAAEAKSNIHDSSSSSTVPSGDITQTSIHSRPSGFADSFASSDGR